MATELAIAVPLVMAERFVRMALAGPAPTERDDREFNLMYAEKAKAFTASWFGMTSAIIRANQDLASSFFRPFDPASLATSTLDIVGKGLAPLHRAATDNVVRLAERRIA